MYSHDQIPLESNHMPWGNCLLVEKAISPKHVEIPVELETWIKILALTTLKCTYSAEQYQSLMTNI